MEKERCGIEGCQRKANFAIYQLKIMGTSKRFGKTWVYVCSIHDKTIAHENRTLKADYPNAVWVEI